MERKNKLSILVLSCDAYSDVWDDFFNLKDIHWSDCIFKTYLVNNIKEYQRSNVKVINCGNNLNWSGRLRLAVEKVDTPYICVFLEDYFIKQKVDNALIDGLVDFVENNKVSFLNLGDTFNHIIGLSNNEYYQEHMIFIPKYLKYGIDTAAAIWDRQFLLKLLGTGDYSAWQFEKDRCDDAKNPIVYENALLLCDERKPLNVSEIPVVIQGLIYPKAIKFFKQHGYTILSKRKVMNAREVFMYRFKCRMSHIKFGRKIIKKTASLLFGYKFVSED